jgi:hypothetical protein
MKCKEIGRCVMERDEPGMKLLKARGVSLLSRRNMFGLNALELSDLFHGPLLVVFDRARWATTHRRQDEPANSRRFTSFS